MTNQPGDYRNSGVEDSATHGPDLMRVHTATGRVELHQPPALAGTALTATEALDLLEALQAGEAMLHELARLQMVAKLRTERGYSDEALRAVGLLPDAQP